MDSSRAMPIHGEVGEEESEMQPSGHPANRWLLPSHAAATGWSPAVPTVLERCTRQRRRNIPSLHSGQPQSCSIPESRASPPNHAWLKAPSKCCSGPSPLPSFTRAMFAVTNKRRIYLMH